MNKHKSVEEIIDFLKPFAVSQGVELVDVEFKVGKDASLTVFIDTEDGVDLDTLEKFHNAIDAPLDELDPSFGEAYTLNVSSPGLDRPLKTERDYAHAVSEAVEIKLFAPEKGKKFFEGILVDYDDNTVTIESGKNTIKFEKNRIAKINKAIKFD